MAFLAPVAGAVGGMGGIGTALSVVGTVASMMGAQQASAYQAAIAERQAVMLESQARDVRQTGQVNQQERDMEARSIIEQERGRQAGSGFSTNSTSFGRRNRAAQVLARRDALRVRQDADREATSLQNQAAGQTAQANLYRSAGQNSMLEGLFGVATDLVNGATFVNDQTAIQINRDARGVSIPYA